MKQSVTTVSKHFAQLPHHHRPLTHHNRISFTCATRVDARKLPVIFATHSALRRCFFTSANSLSSSSMNAPLHKKPINLLRGWPSPSLLPAAALSAAAVKTLADPTAYIPGLQYGPDPGYQPLRESIARWLAAFYPAVDPAPPSAADDATNTTTTTVGAGHHPPDVRRICITGGASQNLACILQSFTDPLYTKNVWMVAPCYFLACPIFADAGFDGRLKAVPEDDDGIDIEYLRKGLEAAGEGGDEVSSSTPGELLQAALPP